MTAPTTPETAVTFTVAWAQFRQALYAVLPCAERKEEFDTVNRVQLELRRTTGKVRAAATDRFIAGCVTLDTLVPPTVDARVDLPLDSVRKILAVFHDVPAGDDLMLQVLISTDQLEIRDVSGLIDGERLTVSRYPERDDVPPVSRLIARQLTSQHPNLTDHVEIELDRFRRFQAAEKCYRASPVLTWTSLAAATVRIGDDFVGLIGVSTGEDAETGVPPLVELWLLYGPELEGLVSRGEGAAAGSSHQEDAL